MRTTVRGLLGLPELQAVQRARARQRMASVALSHPVLAQQVRLAHQHRGQYIVAYLMVIVEVFVAQREPIDALRAQVLYLMLHAWPMAIILKALRHPRHHPRALVHLAQQHPSTVTAEVAAVESSRDSPSSQPMKLNLLCTTLCIQGCFLVVWHKRLFTRPLCHEEQPFSTPSVNFPG